VSAATRILVVEDEAVVAKDLQTRLRKLGYDVPATVQTGQEAIDAAEVHRPELILMDVRLKGTMDGIEASAHIMEKFRTPVIFLTAYADDGTLGRAKLTDPYGFILKPFNERELHTAIQVALHKHQGEMAVRKSERWLAGTLRSIGDAIIAVDKDTNILFMNDVAARLTEWDGKDAAGRPLDEVYRVVDELTGEPFASAAAAYDPNTRIARDESSIEGREGMLVTREGSRVPVEENAAPILDDAGNVSGVVVVFRDILKRKQAEEARRANEEQLRSLANSMSHLAWMAEPDGSFFWFNERWYQYTGKTLEEMCDLGWPAVHDPAVLPVVLQRWSECLHSGSAFDMEFPLRSATGQYRWFLTRVTPVANAEGKVVRWFGTHTDIHEAREIREQLQLANANLAQFAYSASHDLREPLRNVTVFSRLLGQRYGNVLEGQGTEFLGYITQGAIRMESLVTDLLAYAESGKPSDVALEAVDAEAVLKEVLSTLKTAVDESHAQITYSGLPTLITRSVHLRQLFQNLVGNAIKYRSERTPMIAVTAEAAGSEWIFSVEDNGIGIRREYFERVFGLFKRLHTAREYAGTGLGLALCRNVLTLYGGRIWVESELGKGSTFHFSLPRTHAQ
jgi:PAS domain S-box-containing protein